MSAHQRKGSRDGVSRSPLRHHVKVSVEAMRVGRCVLPMRTHPIGSVPVMKWRWMWRVVILACAGSMITSGAAALGSDESDVASDVPTTSSVPATQVREAHDASDGSIAPSIVGGAPITINDAPWQALLAYVDSPSYWQFCGGSILARQWIVTAAHCVDDPTEWSYIQVASGVTNRNGLSLSDFVDVTQIYVHENWNSNTDENDVALLKLATPLDLNGTTRSAIALPLSVSATWPSYGTSGYITGWGDLSSGGSQPDQLHGATLQVLAGVGSSTCGLYGGSYKPTSMLCAGVPAGGVDTCQGDSGGPLAISESGQWILAGITSWGIGCANVNYPGIYTRVTRYVPWILSKLAVPPGAPAITGIESGNGLLKVSFTPPTETGWSTITNYAYSLDGGSWSTLRPTSTASPLVISRLTNGQTYSVRIAAINARGRGDASSSVAGAPIADPPGAPSITRITPGDSSLSIAYRPPASTGGSPITGYEFSLDGGTWAAVTSMSRSALTVTGLVNGVARSVAIRAVNGRGPGTASTAVVATPRRVPDAPTITSISRGERSISVFFSPPAFDGGAAITTYEYSLNGGRWTARRPTGTGSPILIGGVTNARTYSVRIRAVNAAGRGGESISVVSNP